MPSELVARPAGRPLSLEFCPHDHKPLDFELYAWP
jgi:hypothetical protein